MRRFAASAALAFLATSSLISPASAQTDPSTTTTAPQSPPKVVVTNQGAEPRTALRYAYTAGTEQLSDLLLGTSITQRQGGSSRHVTTPAITIGVASEITGATADGGADVVYEFRSIKVDHSKDPKTASRVEDAIAPIAGTAISLSISSRGEVISADASLPDNLDAAAASTFQQLVDQARSLTVPLPEEPVGAGARWKVTETARVSGLEVTQTAHYRLRSVRGTQVRLAVTIDQHAGRQTITDPATGTEIELLSSRATGSGSSSVSLGEPFPRGSSVHIKVDQRLSAEGKTISQTLQLQVAIRPS
jgi:hypothetical protein